MTAAVWSVDMCDIGSQSQCLFFTMAYNWCMWTSISVVVKRQYGLSKERSTCASTTWAWIIWRLFLFVKQGGVGLEVERLQCKHHKLYCFIWTAFCKDMIGPILSHLPVWYSITLIANSSHSGGCLQATLKQCTLIHLLGRVLYC